MSPVRISSARSTVPLSAATPPNSARVPTEGLVVRPVVSTAEVSPDASTTVARAPTSSVRCRPGAPAASAPRPRRRPPRSRRRGRRPAPPASARSARWSHRRPGPVVGADRDVAAAVAGDDERAGADRPHGPDDGRAAVPAPAPAGVRGRDPPHRAHHQGPPRRVHHRGHRGRPHDPLPSPAHRGRRGTLSPAPRNPARPRPGPSPPRPPPGTSSNASTPPATSRASTSPAPINRRPTTPGRRRLRDAAAAPPWWGRRRRRASARRRRRRVWPGRGRPDRPGRGRPDRWRGRRVRGWACSSVLRRRRTRVIFRPVGGEWGRGCTGAGGGGRGDDPCRRPGRAERGRDGGHRAPGRDDAGTRPRRLPPGHRRAGRDAPRPRRVRPARGDPPDRHRGRGHADRPRRGRRPAARPARRRRRLRRQTVRPRRADRPGDRGAAPHRGRARRRRDRRPGGRRPGRGRAPRRRAGRADGHRAAAAGLPGRPARAGGEQGADPEPGLGLDRLRPEPGRGARLRAAPQARRAAAAAHGARHRLRAARGPAVTPRPTSPPSRSTASRSTAPRFPADGVAEAAGHRTRSDLQSLLEGRAATAAAGRSGRPRRRARPASGRPRRADHADHDRRHRLPLRRAGRPRRRPPRRPSPAARRPRRGERPREADRVVRATLADGSALVLTADADQVTSARQRLRRILLALGVAGLVAAGLVTLLTTRLALAPLDDMTGLARSITGGDRGRRLAPARTDTELGRAAAAFDDMLDELEGAESTARASEARTRQFVADAAHELRTPLAGVRAAAEAALDPELPAADRDRLHLLLLRDTQRAARLVDDLLALARIDAGIELHPVPVDLLELARGEVERAGLLAPGLDVRATGPERAVVVPGDPQRLGQVLANLLDNARRHTRPAARSRSRWPPGTAPARSTVSDTGPGVPAADRERIFERLVRLDDARSADAGGAGLGLAIARGIARAHGGELRCTLPRRAPGPRSASPSPAGPTPS
ncbi:hypothetical protein L7F22_065011 [Adiantum nelumboides]|nr:hypothetical protein [Adiantum nelumboides]